MGKPRMIILIRHAQSEGNKNRDIHQTIPDHRVKLTDEGKRQAEEAGHRLRGLLHPDDNIQFFTSPYRRARETTEGILSTLTASDPEYGPSPFPRHTIKVFEEPRLREQDFGNFQPCSDEMTRMWQERADYGHFFYRIPDGESAADAYDRVSGFNESLWRQFSDPDFPSVCVLVTHGLMTRVFLMKWYHWSVEYFEDLRNVNHCEFVIMRQREDNGKYLLENKLRTWSELKRKAAAQASSTPSTKTGILSPGIPPIRKWGGCQGGCRHGHEEYPRRKQAAQLQDLSLPAAQIEDVPTAEKPDNPVGENVPITSNVSAVMRPQTAIRDATRTNSFTSTASSSTTSPTLSAKPAPSVSKSHANASNLHLPFHTRVVSPYGRDAGGSLSGAATPAEGFSDIESDGGVSSIGGGGISGIGSQSAIAAAQKRRSGYFDRHSMNPSGFDGTKNAASASGRGSEAGSERGGDGEGTRENEGRVRKVMRKQHTEDQLDEWVRRGGMGKGTRADALGDHENEMENESGDNTGGEGLDVGGGDDDRADEEVSAPEEVERAMEEDRSLRGSVY